MEGEAHPLPTNVPDEAFKDRVWFGHYSFKAGVNEFFLLYHNGFWPIPNALDSNSNSAFYARLKIYGASFHGPFVKGIVSAEIDYYDSVQDRSGDNPFIPNNQIRGLLRYDLELRKNLNMTVQYYVEQRQQQQAYEASLLPGMRAEDKNYQLIFFFILIIVRAVN